MAGKLDAHQVLDEEQVHISTEDDDRHLAERHVAIDERLEERGAGWYALCILLLCGFGWVSDGAEGVVLSYMLPTLEDVWALSHEQLGFMSTSASFGQALGAAFWGAFADAVGRRPVFLLSLGLTVAFGVASCAAPNFYTYCTLRLLTGFAIGGNLPLAVSVATELLPPSLRERGVVALQLFNEVGSLASTRLAAVMLPDLWRAYLCVVALPAAIVLAAALVRLPESPHWLLSCGRYAEAAAVLEGIEAGRSGVLRACPCPAARGPSLASTDEHSVRTRTHETAGAPPDVSLQPQGLRRRADAARAAAAQVLGLFGPSLWRTTSLLSLLWFSANFASGWWTWMPEFAKLQGIPSDAMYTAVTVARVVAMGAFVLAAAVIARTGAYRLLLVALAGTCLMSFVLTCVVDQPALLASGFFVVAYAVFALFFGVVWPVMYVVTPGGFPSDKRGTGFGFVSAFSKLGGLTQPNVVALLLPAASEPLPPPVAPPLPPHLPPLASSPPLPAPLRPQPQLPPRGPPPPLPPTMPYSVPGHTSLYIIGIIFTISWGVAFMATLVQSVRYLATLREEKRRAHPTGGTDTGVKDLVHAAAPAAEAATSDS